MRLAFLFYEGMTALDLIGPHEVLSRLPGVETVRVARRPGLVATDSGVSLLAEAGLSDVSQADVLVIPGAASATSLRDDEETLRWVRCIHASSTWTTSVCTGSLILGAAGVLEGIRATTHWAAHDRLRDHGAQPVVARVVEDGKLITAAGVSAGIDMALTLAAKIAGPDVARALQLGIEYDPDPPFDCGSPTKAPPAMVARLQAIMARSFEARPSQHAPSKTERVQTAAAGPVGDLFAYSTAVRVGRQVWLSGAAAYNRAGQLVGPGQPYEQAKQALANLKDALEGVGAALSDVVATRIYVLDASAWREVGRAHGEAFKDVRPAATLVEVRALLEPGMLVEIEAEALVRMP
jgi:putative intracellular protease/amidase/enamine deaminase RidA (YjgF/YER057c/UK114 family)